MSRFMDRCCGICIARIATGSGVARVSAAHPGAHDADVRDVDVRSPVRRRLARATVLSGLPSECNRRPEEHTSGLQSLMRISYAVFCLQKTNHHTLYATTVTAR